MRIFSIFCFWSIFRFWANFSDIRHKLFRKVVKTAFSMFRRTLCWEVFFRKVLQFVFWLWAKYFLNLGENFTEKKSKTYPACSENILTKLNFRRIFWSLCILGLWVKVFLNFGSFFANLPKQNSKVQTNTSVSFFGKIHFSRFLVQTFSDVQQNINRKIVKTSFYLFRKPVEETDLFELFNVFRTYSEFEQSFFWLLAESFHIKLSKLLSTCSGSTPGWKTTFFWQNLSGLTSELQKKLFLTIGKSSTHRLSKLFSPCLGNKVKKQIFHKVFGFYVSSDFKRNLFWLLEISLCEFVKTAFYDFSGTLC